MFLGAFGAGNMLQFRCPTAPVIMQGLSNTAYLGQEVVLTQIESTLDCEFENIRRKHERASVIGERKDSDKPNNWLAVLSSRPGNRAVVDFASPVNMNSTKSLQGMVYVDAGDDSNRNDQQDDEYSYDEVPFVNSPPLPRPARRPSLPVDDGSPLPSNRRRRRRNSVESEDPPFVAASMPRVSDGGEEEMEYVSDYDSTLPISLRVQNRTLQGTSSAIQPNLGLPSGGNHATVASVAPAPVNRPLTFASAQEPSDVDIDEEALRQQFGDFGQHSGEEYPEEDDYPGPDEDAEEAAEVARAIAAVAAMEEAERSMTQSQGLNASDDMELDFTDD